MRIIDAPVKGVGGIHPAYYKDATSGRPIEVMPLPKLLRVSMSQHLGAPAKPTVKKGDTVLRGQLIGEAAGFISAAVHAPTSGKVLAVEDAPTASGAVAAAVSIEPDGADQWIEGLAGLADWEHADAKTLIGLVQKAGIAGMGGAGFPTHVKLSPPPGKKIDTLIINGAECEPYLTADHRLMVERAEQVWTGIRIIQRALDVRIVRVAIESNKPDAIEAMRVAGAALEGDVAVVRLKTEYPQGAEKQQIYAITGREVPSGGLPMDVGALVENVGTALAITDAVVRGLPLTERVTTVTGTPVARPSNVLARIGTVYADLLAFCGGLNGACKLVSGGPMMGLAQDSAETSTTKTTSGLLALAADRVSQFTSMPCIACGRCVDACPMHLMPAELSQFLETEDFDAAESYNVLDCIECGCCAYECPAHRPLVQHMRQGKSRVMLKRRQQQAKQAEKT